MTGHVVDRDQRQLVGPGDHLGGSDPDQQGTDQPGAIGNGHGRQIIVTDSGLRQGLVNTAGNPFDVVTTGHLRNHPTKPLVTVNLGSHHVAEDLGAVLNHGHTGFITTGFKR